MPVPLDDALAAPEIVGVVDALPLEADWETWLDAGCDWPVPLLLALAPFWPGAFELRPGSELAPDALDAPPAPLTGVPGWDGAGEALTSPDVFDVGDMPSDDCDWTAADSWDGELELFAVAG